MNSRLIIIWYVLTRISVYRCQTDEIFCYSKDRLNCMMIVGTNIFIGTRTYLYRYSLELNKIVDALSTDELFGPDFAEVFGGGIFDFNPCAANRLSEFCQNAGKAKDLVFIFGKTNGHYRRYGYNSYRTTKISPFFIGIQNNKEMPWNLSPKGRLNESIWPKGVGEDHVEDLTGLAFISEGNVDTLYLSTQVNDGSYHSGAIISKPLQSNGLFDTNSEWKDAGLGGSGLFDLNRLLFILDDRNKVHQMKYENDYYSKHKSFDAKEFFNCYNNSILLDITAKMRNTPTLPTIRITKITTTTTTTTTKKATTLTTKAKTITVSSAESTTQTRFMPVISTTAKTNEYDKSTEESTDNWSTNTTQNISIITSTEAENKDKNKTKVLPWILFLLGIFVALIVIAALCILMMWLRKKKPNENKRKIKIAGQTEDEENEGKDDLDAPPEYLLEEIIESDKTHKTDNQSVLSTASQRSKNEKTQTTDESDRQRSSSALSKSSRRSANEENLNKKSEASVLSTASKRSKNEKSFYKSKTENM